MVNTSHARKLSLTNPSKSKENELRRQLNTCFVTQWCLIQTSPEASFNNFS